MLRRLSEAAGGPLLLTRATVPACLVDPPATAIVDGLALVDLTLVDGRIAAVAPHAGGSADADGLDLERRMVWPCSVDMHTHLDKGHIRPRAPNPDGTFAAALATVQADRERNWRAADVRRRFEFGLRCAYAHGTAAIRTHLDSIPPQDAISWPVFAELRAVWAGRIELQAVSLAMPEHYRGAAGAALARRVADHGGVLGLVPQMTAELAADLDRFLGLAAEHGLDVDCHVDESLDPAARSLRHLAQAALRRRFPGRIVAGHCCSLAQQPPDEVDATLDLVAEAGIGVVSLPMCNLYLQDRAPGRTPRQRGVTLAHELRRRGVQVAFASDNCRDPFYGYGDHDLLEVFREAVRIAHLDHPVGDWASAVTTVPAALMGLPGRGRVAAGQPADLILFEGRDWSEVLTRPESTRIVLRRGVPIETRPPPYAELDEVAS